MCEMCSVDRPLVAAPHQAAGEGGHAPSAPATMSVEVEIGQLALTIRPAAHLDGIGSLTRGLVSSQRRSRRPAGPGSRRRRAPPGTLRTSGGTGAVEQLWVHGLRIGHELTRCHDPAQRRLQISGAVVRLREGDDRTKPIHNRGAPALYVRSSPRRADAVAGPMSVSKCSGCDGFRW